MLLLLWTKSNCYLVCWCCGFLWLYCLCIYTLNSWYFFNVVFIFIVCYCKHVSVWAFVWCYCCCCCCYCWIRRVCVCVFLLLSSTSMRYSRTHLWRRDFDTVTDSFNGAQWSNVIFLFYLALSLFPWNKNQFYWLLCQYMYLLISFRLCGVCAYFFVLIIVFFHHRFKQLKQ